MTTIADIARLAGVSKSTVSRALNDSPLIGVETKERIRALAEEHAFEISAPARRLSLGQSHVAGLVLFDHGKGPYTPDMFMLEIMGGISTGLHEQGYELLVLQAASDDPTWARRYVDSGRADGFIVLSASCTPKQLRMLIDSGTPFVVWGSHSPGHEYSSVSGDSVVGGRLATEHLLATGRRRIAFVGGPTWATEVLDRRRGYEDALRDAGLEVDPDLVVHLNWEAPEQGAKEALGELLAREPELDGVFANSDRYAIGALDALKQAGRSVPADVGVVGYDDVALAAHTNPPLTTIRQDGVLAGKLLARTLLQQIQTGAVTDVSMPAQLVVRESA